MEAPFDPSRSNASDSLVTYDAADRSTLIAESCNISKPPVTTFQPFVVSTIFECAAVTNCLPLKCSSYKLEML